MRKRLRLVTTEEVHNDLREASMPVLTRGLSAVITIEAKNAPVWHGVPCTGLKIKDGGDTLIFSLDTVHDKMLWKQCCACGYYPALDDTDTV